MSAQLKRTLLVLLIALVAGMAAGAHAYPYGSRTLVVGSRGEDVQELQRRLRTLGYAPGPADGIFGPQTRAAVMAFQRDQGLPAGGAAGRLTTGVLDLAYARHRSRPYTVQSGDTLFKLAQDHGTDVASIRWLNRLSSDLLRPGQQLLIPLEPLPLPHRPTPEPTQPLVVGYYAEDWPGDQRALRSLRAAAGVVDLVVSFDFRLDAQGRLHGREPTALLRWARERQVPVHMLIHNYHGDRFDREIARGVLSSAWQREQAAQTVVQAAAERGYAGVNLDLEAVPPELRQAYTDLVARLGEHLHRAGMTLSISIPAKVQDLPRDAWAGAFDYAALGRLADLVMIMAYDEHTPGWPAGPVASAGWVERVAAYAAREIPREKLILGVPQYGYDWVFGSTTGRALAADAAAHLAQERGAAIAWDNQGQVPTFTYWDHQGQRRVVYFENRYSLVQKLQVVQRQGLRGIAIWRLGLEDEAIWPVLTAWRRTGAVALQ